MRPGIPTVRMMMRPAKLPALCSGPSPTAFGELVGQLMVGMDGFEPTTCWVVVPVSEINRPALPSSLPLFLLSYIPIWREKPIPPLAPVCPGCRRYAQSASWVVDGGRASTGIPSPLSDASSAGVVGRLGGEPLSAAGARFIRAAWPPVTVLLEDDYKRRPQITLLVPHTGLYTDDFPLGKQKQSFPLLPVVTVKDRPRVSALSCRAVNGYIPNIDERNQTFQLHVVHSRGQS